MSGDAELEAEAAAKARQQTAATGMSRDAELEAEAAAKARQQTVAIDAYPSDASMQSLPESPDGYSNNAFMHTISDIAELRLHDAFESAPSLSLDDLDDYQQVKQDC